MTFWIETCSGQAVDLLDPDPITINIEDIAHALGKLCRFTGHCPSHYSVAQHSVLVSKVVPSGYALDGLLHDASEAYVGDVSSPLKRAMRELSTDTAHRSPYDQIEDRIGRVIAKKFGLTYPHPDCVKSADLNMVLTEKNMLGKCTKPWEVKGHPYSFLIVPQDSGTAEFQFLKRFRELTK